MSNSRRVCILGGSGFVGTHLCNRLHADGFRLRVLTRHRERSRHLLVIPSVELVELDVNDPILLREAMEGADIVVNLVGILNEHGDRGKGFHKAHVELTTRVIDFCKRNGTKRLLHMSGLHAAANGPSNYLRSKGIAEDHLMAARGDLNLTIFRPSVIFGPEDSFLNRFAGLLRLAPVLPLAKPNARFAPVFVGDVVEAFARSIDDKSTFGRRYDLCGPQIYTLRQLVEYAKRQIGGGAAIIGLSDGLSKLQAAVFEHVPGKPFSKDNLRSMSLDSVCGGENGLLTLGITPTPLESVAPQYLGHHKLRCRYDAFRSAAGRARAY
jgi:NADH dehydrogenase